MVGLCARLSAIRIIVAVRHRRRRRRCLDAGARLLHVSRTMSAITPERLVVPRSPMVSKATRSRTSSSPATCSGRRSAPRRSSSIVGGITASPFPFGDAGDRRRAVVAGARAPDLIDPARTTVLVPVLARQRLDVARLRRRRRCRRCRRSASPIWSRRGSTASAARAPVTYRRREPRRARRHRVRGAPSRARRAARHDLAPGCGPTAGAPRRATCSASSCATASAPATSRPAWRARASSAC